MLNSLSVEAAVGRDIILTIDYKGIIEKDHLTANKQLADINQYIFPASYT